MLVQSVCSRIAAVRERIASLEASVQIEQDHRRNGASHSLLDSLFKVQILFPKWGRIL